VITIFGLFDLPRLVPRGLKLSAAAQNLHDNGQYLLYALLVLHIGAALYHRFVLKDGILQRMWPAWRKAGPAGQLQSGEAL
jgi:cytochrome b561